MPPSPPPLREVASPVEHLSNLIQRGSLAQILYELRTNVVWATPAPPPPPAASPAPAAHLLPSPIDQLTTLGQPLLSLALESSAWRSDALECFVLLLQAGANPERRDSVGRRVEWELEGRDEAFRREWVRAREARRARRAYELPIEIKNELAMLYRTYVVLLKEEEEKEVAAERAREAQVAAEEEMDRQRSSAPAARPSPSPEPARGSPSLPDATNGSVAVTAPPKRPLVSRLPPPPPKRSRRESTAEDLPSYEDAALPEDPSREDVKPIVRRPPTRLPPRNLSSTASASPAPPPSRLFSQPRASASTSPAPPASPQAFVRIRRLPPWITETLLTHWLTYGALIFDKCADPAVASSMVAKGYYRRMPRVPPPKPLSVELVKGEAHGGEPEGFGAVQRMALVGYASEEDAWRVKKGFDTMRVLPASLGDEMVEVTLG